MLAKMITWDIVWDTGSACRSLSGTVCTVLLETFSFAFLSQYRKPQTAKTPRDLFPAVLLEVFFHVLTAVVRSSGK